VFRVGAFAWTLTRPGIFLACQVIESQTTPNRGLRNRQLKWWCGAVIAVGLAAEKPLVPSMHACRLITVELSVPRGTRCRTATDACADITLDGVLGSDVPPARAGNGPHPYCHCLGAQPQPRVCGLQRGLKFRRWGEGGSAITAAVLGPTARPSNAAMIHVARRNRSGVACVRSCTGGVGINSHQLSSVDASCESPAATSPAVVALRRKCHSVIV
jgi:hypothetical protein